MNSWKIIDRIWHESQLKDTELLLLLAIAHHVNKRGVAYPGIKRLARFIRRGERTVQRLIRELEIKGYLQVGYGLGPKGTNMYRICTPVPHDRAMTGGVTLNGKLSGDIQATPELITSELSKIKNGLKNWEEGSEMWQSSVERIMELEAMLKVSD